PSFVFSNACHSGQTEEWKMEEEYEKVYGLANAFLIAGVRHYLGTFWEIQDEAGLHFALDFYSELMNGAMIGEAVRNARLKLIDRYGEDVIIWSSYMLYGDPTFRYVDYGKAEYEGVSAGEERMALAGGPSRAADESVVVFPSGSNTWKYVTATIAIIAIILAAMFISRGDRTTPQGTVSQPGQPAVVVDDKKGERKDALVADLAKKYRAGDIQVPTRTDEWTSWPLSLVFLDIKANGVSEGEKDFILAKATEALQGTKRVDVVEREILDKLLSELQLSSSDLADPSTALRIGKILSARLIVTGSMVREKNDWMTSLRMIVTETTSVKSAITIAMQTKDRNAVADELSKKLIDRVNEGYPLQAKIVKIDGDKATINIGSDVGLANGIKMEVLAEDGSSIGEIETSSVRSDKTSVKILSKDEDIKAGARVREIL
ncbi:MAG: CHAT domain-containing protein, partial [Nitrospirota bacterium]